MGAVLVPWRGTLPAPRADQLAALRSLPTDSVAKGRALHAALRPASYSAMVLGLAVALGLGLTPAGARLVARCASPFGGGWVAQAVVGGLVVIFVGSLVTLPLTARRQAILRHYGLSTQSWGGWVVDLLKGYAITAVLGGLLLVGFYALTRYVPRWWWAWASAGAAVLVIVFAFVFPILIEPIFNKFTPMPDGPLRTDLITMAAHDGVPVRDVLVADASRRTRAVNAYVSGFGATRRIVVYDTLLEQASPAEVRSVVAHELGHARDNDVLSGAAIGAVGAAAGVIAVYLIGSWPGLLKRAGVGGLGDPRSVALLLALAALAGLIGGPVGNLATRKIEARADAHALTITGDPATFEAMQARLSAVNLADPDPNRLEYLLFATHPSTVERMAEARAYARSHRSGA
jgi:STE24 endopeptidase